MTKTPPPEPSPPQDPSQPVDGLFGELAADGDEGGFPTGELAGEPQGEGAFTGEVEASGDDDLMSVGEADEGQGETVTNGTAEEQPSWDEEGLVVVAPLTSDQSRSSKRRFAFRDTGWKMMAAAGIALLLAGFAAGLFFPESLTETPVSEEEVVVTTTRATGSTTASQSTVTSSIAAASSSTTIAAAAPIASEVVPPPDLVVTDEPVADVADRLVPSVVHLEITSQNILEQGAGSGVIFDSEGLILTAAHVVAPVLTGEAELTVRLTSGDRLPGEVVGSDPDSDVAVVKVERSGLVAAELALDPPRVGQLVVAVGSPWGLESSVTSGVISATDRIVGGKLLIQSDAVLYPGNSGGALADRYGRLIGINVSIFTDSTTLEPVAFQGVGFAVPMDVAYRVAQALIAGEPVDTTFLGVSGRDSLGDAGVEIMEVFPGSGAETGGIMAGDVIVAVNGRPVTGIADLAARIRHRVPGDVLVLTVLRGEEELTLTATLLPRSEVMPDQQGEDSPEEEPESESP